MSNPRVEAAWESGYLNEMKKPKGQQKKSRPRVARRLILAGKSHDFRITNVIKSSTLLLATRCRPQTPKFGELLHDGFRTERGVSRVRFKLAGGATRKILVAPGVPLPSACVGEIDASSISILHHDLSPGCCCVEVHFSQAPTPHSHRTTEFLVGQRCSVVRKLAASILLCCSLVLTFRLTSKTQYRLLSHFSIFTACLSAYPWRPTTVAREEV
jgi:hypothetical protein